MAKFIGGEGPIGAKLMIVGEAPYQGESAEEIDSFCFSAGIEKPKAYITNVRKYNPPFNNFKLYNPGEPSYDEQLKILQNEIETIKPNCILALGEHALNALAGRHGITKWRGSILQSYYGPKVVSTFHPASLIRGKKAEETEDGEAKGIFNYRWKQVIRLDFERAFSESKFADYNIPDRHIEICRSSLDLQRFYERSDKSRPLSVDIEASRCIPICVGLSFDRSEAISIPLFNRMSHLHWDGMSSHELSYIWKDLAEILSIHKIVGQNFKYDEDKLYRLGFRLNLWGDCLLLAHTLNPEMPAKSLALLTSIWTRQPYYKDDGKEFFDSKNKQKDFPKLLRYNGMDAAVQSEVHEEMLKEAVELGLDEYYFKCMIPRHKFYLDMERIGFKQDLIVRDSLLSKYQLLYQQVHDATTQLLGHELNVASNPQVTKCLYLELKFPPRFKRGTANTEFPKLVADEETITALLANHARTTQQKQVANNILDERKIRKTLSTYILAKPDYDGRMRTSYNIVGADTDRTSTSNISTPVRPEKSMGLGFQTLTKHGDIGSDICEMFVPDDGMVFLNVDGSQAEARVVFVLAKEFELLAQLDNPDFDIHWKTAKLFFSELPELILCKRSLSKEDPRRFIGKTIRHAAHLGAKKHKVMESVNTDAKKYGIDISISEWRAGKYLEAFHAANPNVRMVYHKEIEEYLNTTRILFGPSLINPFDEPMRHGRRRAFFDRWSDDLLKSAFADIPQSTITNQTKFAGIRIKNRLPDLQIILEGHDALLAQVPKGDVDEVAFIMREEFEKPIDFSTCTLKRDYKLIIPAEFSIGEKNYKDLVKYKLSERKVA